MHKRQCCSAGQYGAYYALTACPQSFQVYVTQVRPHVVCVTTCWPRAPTRSFSQPVTGPTDPAPTSLWQQLSCLLTRAHTKVSCIADGRASVTIVPTTQVDLSLRAMVLRVQDLSGPQCTCSAGEVASPSWGSPSTQPHRSNPRLLLATCTGPPQ